MRLKPSPRVRASCHACVCDDTARKRRAQGHGKGRETKERKFGEAPAKRARPSRPTGAQTNTHAHTPAPRRDRGSRQKVIKVHDGAADARLEGDQGVEGHEGAPRAATKGAEDVSDTHTPTHTHTSVGATSGMDVDTHTHSHTRAPARAQGKPRKGEGEQDQQQDGGKGSRKAPQWVPKEEYAQHHLTPKDLSVGGVKVCVSAEDSNASRPMHVRMHLRPCA